MKLTPKRKRSDSASAAIAATQAAALPPLEPPAHVLVPAGARPFWDAIVQARRELPWATVADPDGTLLTRYGLKAVPAFVVVAPDGRLSSVSVGYTSEAGMRLRLWWAGLWAGG